MVVWHQLSYCYIAEDPYDLNPLIEPKCVLSNTHIVDLKSLEVAAFRDFNLSLQSAGHLQRKRLTISTFSSCVQLLQMILLPLFVPVH